MKKKPFNSEFGTHLTGPSHCTKTPGQRWTSSQPCSKNLAERGTEGKSSIPPLLQGDTCTVSQSPGINMYKQNKKASVTTPTPF